MSLLWYRSNQIFLATLAHTHIEEREPWLSFSFSIAQLHKISPNGTSNLVVN